MPHQESTLNQMVNHSFIANGRRLANGERERERERERAILLLVTGLAKCVMGKLMLINATHPGNFNQLMKQINFLSVRERERERKGSPRLIRDCN